MLQDCELLNLYDRPEKLIVTEIAVPPAPIRPSGFVGFGRTRSVFFFFCLSHINTVVLVIFQLNDGLLLFKVSIIFLFLDQSVCSNEDSITSILKNIINTNSILREDLEGGAPASKCIVSLTSI